ncbi:MAG: M20 family metallopeptidase [Acidobacteriota bacterium]
MNDSKAALRAAIASSGWQELLQALVRTPSHPGIRRQEEATVAALESYLETHGIPCVTAEILPGRPNLLAEVSGSTAGRHLVLCGHTDTVPLNLDDPGFGFSGETRDGNLYGRGACDMKGAVAAMAAAMVALRATGAMTGGRVTLAAVIDEEMESLGAEALVKGGFRADGAIVGEPTGNRLALGHKGLEWLEIAFIGRAAHGGTPQAGINAIVAAAKFIDRVDRDLQPLLRARVHPLLGPPTFNCGTIAGGDQPSTVAASCRLRIDRRSVPGETYESMLAEIRELLLAVESELPGLATSVSRMPGGMATFEHLSSVLDERDPLAIALSAVCTEVRGGAEPATSFPAWTDAALLSNFAAIPCAVLGPGDLAQAHSPREFVPLREVEEAALIYALVAESFCGGGGRPERRFVLP